MYDYTVTEADKYGRHSEYADQYSAMTDREVRKMERLYDSWDAKFYGKVSLRKPRHSRPDSMKYISNFPKGKEIVLVYPQFDDTVTRWVPVIDEYGYEQHDGFTF